MSENPDEKLGIIERLRRGLPAPELSYVADREGIGVEEIVSGIVKGEIVFPANRCFPLKQKPCAIGRGLRTKVNANIGTSTEVHDFNDELAKLRVAVDAGADTVMDLSTGGPIAEIRKALLAVSPIPFGTVPAYDLITRFCGNGNSIHKAVVDDFLKVVEEHGEIGVDFVTVHAGLTTEALSLLKSEGRIAGIVSRGGSFIADWMLHNGKENPYYEYFDELLEIARKFDLVLSLGDGLRPGAIKDGTDKAQIKELSTLGELEERALSRGVQVIIEGPGHIKLDEIETNVRLEKELCHGAPFYVLGPIVTDVAPGYDHITSAIGGAIAASHGADFLCYVTPGEHLRLPTEADVREGVIAARIAAHAADLVKLGERARRWDDSMSRARFRRDWEAQIRLALDPKQAGALSGKEIEKGEGCTMCGDYCSYKVSERILANKGDSK
ncbi:MAG: phosphomethylpyrimidine synthase ThiC [Candidatus Omnitrophica bacterium]|nr:phosphomethylpyrimidine synthase ThiC [Candidatus Omnitrophota bacterium]